MDLVAMVLQAGIAVQIVMVLLALMSVYVWIVLVAKLWQVRSLYKKSQAFKQKFETSKDLVELYHSTLELKKTKKDSVEVPLEQIFIDGFEEFLRQAQATENQFSFATKSVQGRMWQTYHQQIEIIEQRSSTLATIGSSAPYIGLFGTVLGIINAFQGLAQVQHATLALVAPGISEALIATAMGLFVAIPAVVGYNRLQTTTQRLSGYFESFMETFSRLIERQLLTHVSKKGD